MDWKTASEMSLFIADLRKLTYFTYSGIVLIVTRVRLVSKILGEKKREKKKKRR